MLANMGLAINLRRVIAASLFVLLVSSCEQIAAPVPGAAAPTQTSESATETPALLSFPTSALDTPTAAAATALVTPPALASLPVVQLVSPIPNTQISISQTIYVVAYAADDNGIARIEFFDDNTLVRAETAPTPAPPVFSAIVPWTPADLGSHVLRVVAYDTANHTSAPEETTVSVTPDTRRPTALILYPLGTPQVELGSILQLQVAAIDEVGVTQLDLIVDNQPFTYVTSPTANGQSPFPTVFSWPALTLGAHTLVVRAHDNQDTTNDSAALKVQVVDTHAPALNVAFDRTSAPANEPITITITALDVSGVQRVELWVGKDTASVTTSGNPARQTSMIVQSTWQSATSGDYQLSVRAYNANGNFKQSPPQTISILQPGQSPSTRVPAATPTRTRVPRATATPRLQPPAPPSAELLSPGNLFSAPSPLRVTFGGKGNAELDHLELWGYYQDQPMPQLICIVDARSTTQKNAQCDWAPPAAGVVSMFAQAVDSYRQSGKSPTVTGFVAVPIAPTPTATPILFSGRWTSPLYAATLRQTGSTLRGEFRTNVSGKDIDGRITSGTVKSDQLSFHVDFPSPSTATSTPVPGTEVSTPPTTLTPSGPIISSMDFDCNIDPAAITLTCNWKDDRGRNGSVLLRRETASP